MKSFTKTLIITFGIVISFSSCQKDLETQTTQTTTDALYFRLEGVRDDSSSVYSPIQAVKMN